MSELLALGISHKTAPVALRERLAFTEAQAREFAEGAIETAEVREAVVICTCNRTEVYLVVGDSVRAEGDVLGLLARRADIRPTELAESIYSPRNCDAARQLYRVTAGLESMIVGEAEIQGQVRRAHEAALRGGCTGPLSNRLFAAALTTGKRVRSETGIGAGRASVPSVAVDLALSVLGGLEDRHVVILGAGETSELTARALAEQGAGTIFVANRHADRALSLAQRFGGSVVGLDGLPEQLALADIVLSSTSSPHPIVGRDELAQVMRQRDSRGGRVPLLLIDIAVPRDIDAGCSELEGVSLYDIDDLQAVVARNLDTRAGEIPRAQEIVEEEIQRFARWLGQLDVLPTVSALREHGTALVEQVLAENEGRWESASPRDLARVEAIARAIMSRLLHEPTIRLRNHGEARGHATIELVRELFGLRDEELPDALPGPRPTHRRRTRCRTTCARSRAAPAPAAPAPPDPRAMSGFAHPMSGLRIGTRGSALALVQAEQVTALLAEQCPGLEVEITVVRVSGDAPLEDTDDRGIQDTSGASGGPAIGVAEDKSRWVDAIEDALLAGEIDLAVHSAKDVPGELADGLALLGAPARADVEDALCGAGSLDTLASGARIGTSSIRRAAQLRAAREDLEVVTMGGNVDTRLRILARGDFDAIVLARAGLQRLGREDAIGAVLDPARFVPAPGQGALALEARAGDSRVGEAVAAITDADTFACLLAERAVASALNASCHTPLGAYATPAGCGCLGLRAWVGLPDGSAWVADELLGGFYDPASLGRRVAERLSAAGARELLARAQEMAAVVGG